MQYMIVLAIVITAIVITLRYRTQRDREALTARVRSMGGEVVTLQRMKKGHPFPDTTRGWWAWRVEWRDGAGSHAAWALTTREGIAQWRD